MRSARGRWARNRRIGPLHRRPIDARPEEALVAAFAVEARPADGDAGFWRERLRYLLDYEDAFDDAKELFEEAEVHGLIRAIAGLKVLDPACGSGAFPMGVLHKLTLALRRLDADNRRWESLQKTIAGERATAAFDTRDQTERDAELQEISDTFERYRESDFGRKLYLIQNSIFGVDIQPVACQIAKLRFFISLAIEQQADPAKDNLGIKPLPNLETRFVAADALSPLRSDGTEALTGPSATTLQRALCANRERYFHARTRRKKPEAMEADGKLRQKLAEELTKIGLHSDEAERVAHWDPYDQNATAGWFDAEYTRISHQLSSRGGQDAAVAGRTPASHFDGEARSEGSATPSVSFGPCGPLTQILARHLGPLATKVGEKSGLGESASRCWKLRFSCLRPPPVGSSIP